MMSITLLVLFLFLRYYQQNGGAVFIDGGGSGTFVRVHFKDNTATEVRDLLFSLNVTPVLSIQKHLSSFHFLSWKYCLTFILLYNLFVSLFVLLDTRTEWWCSVHHHSICNIFCRLYICLCIYIHQLFMEWQQCSFW